MANIIHDPLRSSVAPPIPSRSMMPHIVEKGFIDFEQPEEPSHRDIGSTVAGQQSQRDTSSESPSISSPVLPQQDQPPNSSPNERFTTQETIEKLARKRVADSLAECLPAKKARKRRTCVKCAEPTCPGSQTVKNCKNPCRDCGEKSCRGRNSKKPSTPCHLAWI